MAYEWAPLYLVACNLLGDESLAGELLMQARSEADLAARLERMAPLPERPPEPTPDVVELVAVLRQRSERRRRTARTWGIAAVVAVAASVTALMAGPFSKPVDKEYLSTPLVTVERDGLVLEVHEVNAGPDGLTAWWSLSGPDAGDDASAVDVSVQTPTGIIPAGRFGTVTRSARRDWLLGQTHFPDIVLPVRQEVAFLFELGQRQWVADITPERRALEAVERRMPVNQVVDSGGVGVLIKSVVTSPSYTVVEWEPWLAPEVAPSVKEGVGIVRVETESGYLDAKGGKWASYTHFGPLPARAAEVRLFSNGIVREVSFSLPVEAGAHGESGSFRVERSVSEGGALTVELSGIAGSPEIVMAMLEDERGTMYWPVTFGAHEIVDPGGRPMRFLASFHTESDARPRTLHLKMLREYPPLAMTLPLQP